MQGNLDPTAAASRRASDVSPSADDVLRARRRAPGHIFNLGHGILPETPVETVKAVIDLVHEWKGVRS